MAVSREAVIWAFRLVLGREAEHEEGIAAHMKLADTDALMATLLRSPEFVQRGRLKSVVTVREHSAARTPKLPWVAASRSSLRVTIFGNCQIGGLARALQALTGDVVAKTIETTPAVLKRLLEGDFDLKTVLENTDIVLVQRIGEIAQMVRKQYPQHAAKLRLFPSLSYNGFHPDCVYVLGPSGYLQGPMGEYHSSIALWAWQQGLSLNQTQALFEPEVFAALGFDTYHDVSRQALVQIGRQCQLPMAMLLERWGGQGCWMHSVNHPKIGPLMDLGTAILQREDIEPLPVDVNWIDDGLAHWPVWPVYPGLAEPHGIDGSFQFKLDRGLCPADTPVLSLDLPAFLDASFRRYSEFPLDALRCDRIAGARYDALHRFVRQPPSVLRRTIDSVSSTWRQMRATPKGDSPYQGLPDVQFWRRAIERVDRADVDPAVRAAFRIERGHKVATAGSCFAQHISRTLQAQGFNFFQTEPAPADLSPDDARARGFGVYSARFGNLYTARQLVQLFDRAHGDFVPVDRSWLNASGRHVDPFRPQIEPEAHASQAAVVAATQTHLQAVRTLFAELDVFVFTLGLTEAWRSKQDGAVFPLAPGVVAGEPDPQRYEFVNFGVREVAADLHGFIDRLHRVNPGARVIFTVSPVPLIATFENRHVLVSTTYSKAVLRAAAGEVFAPAAGVDYFPSYEVITGAHARGAYFEDDLRSVTASGVDHVMRLFLLHYTGDAALIAAQAPHSKPDAAMQSQKEELAKLNDLVCDEEAIDRHRR